MTRHEIDLGWLNHPDSRARIDEVEKRCKAFGHVPERTGRWTENVVRCQAEGCGWVYRYDSSD